MSWWLFLIPLASAFSCWLVIKMLFILLFRPQNPKSLLGLHIQGVFPAKQPVIAFQIGKLAAKEFFSTKIIEEKITDPANLQKIMPAIEEHIDDFLRNKLKKEMPVVGMFVGDKTINSLKKVFLAELESLFPKIMGKFVSNMANDINIEQLVSQKINGISIEELETAFYKNFSGKLKLVSLFGTLIGLLIGFVTMMIIYYIK
jgi:uncharacterized membrane protein YheB (UPF0754 family)